MYSIQPHLRTSTGPQKSVARSILKSPTQYLLHSELPDEEEQCCNKHKTLNEEIHTFTHVNEPFTDEHKLPFVIAKLGERGSMTEQLVVYCDSCGNFNYLSVATWEKIRNKHKYITGTDTLPVITAKDKSIQEAISVTLPITFQDKDN